MQPSRYALIIASVVVVKCKHIRIILYSVNNVLILMTFSNIVQAVHGEAEGGGQLNPLLYYTLSYISNSK